MADIIDRQDFYLASATGDYTGTLPEPVERADFYLKKIAEGGSSNTYSTTETQIGTWIDGKAIYRKVIEISNVKIPAGYNAFNLTSYVSSLNIAQYIDAKLISPDNQCVINDGVIVLSGVHYLMNMIELGATTNNKKVVIEYTKTTD